MRLSVCCGLALWEQRSAGGSLPAIAVDEAGGKPFFPDAPGDPLQPQPHGGGRRRRCSRTRRLGWTSSVSAPSASGPVERIAGVRTEAAFFRSWVRREARVKRTGSRDRDHDADGSAAEPGEFYYEVARLSWLRRGCRRRTSRSRPQPVHRLMLDQLLLSSLTFDVYSI